MKIVGFLIIMALVLLGDYLIYILAKARTEFVIGEKFVDGMKKRLNEIDCHECIDTYECNVDIAKLDTWDDAFHLLIDIM